MDAEAFNVSPEQTLIAHCRAGDMSAWKALHDAHFDFVYRIASQLGTPSTDVDDVCQETFLVAFRKLSSFRDGRFTTWLYRITANIVASQNRRRAVRRALQRLWGNHDRESAPGPDTQLEARRAEATVSDILARIAPKKREVFALFELERLSGEEIAERVGCKLETVWTRLYYARKDFERLVRERNKERNGGRETGGNT